MKKVDIGEWLSDLLNDGVIKDREDFLITVNGREIVVLEPVYESDGDISFKVKNTRM